MTWASRGTLLDGKHNVPRPPAPDGYYDAGAGTAVPPPATKRKSILSYFSKAK